MATRRWLLFLLSLGSLVLLVYASVAFAFSVPVTERAVALQGEGLPEPGARAIVVPVVEPSLVPTFAQNESGFGDRPGALLAIGDSRTAFPAGAEEPVLARALARVQAGDAANATLNLTGVPGVGDAGAPGNLTIDVAALGGNRTGFIVKGDNESAPRFVEDADVLGQVERFERPASLVMAFASGSFGFVTPLILLVLTHRGAGRRGAAGELAICRECRAPLPKGDEFCARCGAWREPKP